ncbi:MAG: acetylornithine deacetylase [Lysobacterales bacterium]|jgi:acetylornithine deacetylase
MNTGVHMERLLRHLKALVAYDTQNPPRRVVADSLIFEYLRTALGDKFKVKVTDHGKGRVSFFAVRGTPDRLFNVHIDTVPVLAGSKFPPLEMTQHKDRVYGRGTCDIKSAAASLLTIAQTCEDPLALLFTTDEEGGEGCCVEKFIESGSCEPFEQVIVSEPTKCKVELVHRGYLSAKGEFTGVSGHSSERRCLEDSAVHRMSRWASAAIAEAKKADEEGLRTCFNIGTIQGGVKSNLIADNARLHWSARLLPGQSNSEFLNRMFRLEAGEHAKWEVPFAGPPLPTDDHETERSESFASIHDLETGSGLDFWTEASLFSEAGIPALVFGPGDIAQAHTVDEWVSLEQLEKALPLYKKMVRGHA